MLRVVLDDILCPSNVQVAIAKMSEELTKPYEEKYAVLQTIESEIADLNKRQSRVMEAYEAGAYTVDQYSHRIAPLRATEADLKAKMEDVAGELDHQTAVLARPEEVLQFASQLSDFLKRSSPKDRKQMLNRFIKCIWIEPGKGTVVYRIPLPRDAKRPHATELVLALEEPVPPTIRLTPHTRGWPFPRLLEGNQGLGEPAQPGESKERIFESRFVIPKRKRPKAKQKTTNRKKATPQLRTPKPRVEPTPAEMAERQEKRREYERQRAQTPERKELKRRSTQERRDKAKLLGICVKCGAPPISDETRCQTCTLRHREYQKQARERAKKQREQASGQTRIF